LIRDIIAAWRRHASPGRMSTFEKLQVHSKLQAVVAAARLGIIDL
jgi:hypothetical protein